MPIPFIATLGQQVAGQAATGAVAMGLQRIGANYDRRQQMKTAEQMQALQIRGNEELMNYATQNEINNFGPEAIKNRLKEANLNPALMYGSGGAGGQSAPNSPTVGKESAGIIPTGNSGAPMGIMTAAQLNLMRAQADNLDADSKVKTEGLPNIPLQGKNIEANTQALLQGIVNKKAEKALTEAQTRISEIIGNITEETQDDAIKKFHAETNNAIDTAHLTMNEAGISDKTIKDKITIIKQDAIGKVLDNVLKTTENKLKEEQITAIKEGVKNMINMANLKWTQENRNALHGVLTQQGVDDKAAGVIEKILGGIISLF